MALLETTRLSRMSVSGWSEHTFATFDGVKLFFRHWQPPQASDKALVLLHRGHEHSGRLQHLAEELNLPDCHVFAWDARGHGRSPGERGYAENFAVVIKDIDCFVKHIAQAHDIPTGNMIVLGHSVGAVGVAAWVHDYAPPVRAMILATPAFRVKLYVPLAMPALRLRNRLGKSFIKSYVSAKMLTHDPEQAARYEADPLISRNIATNILLDLDDTSTRLLADAGAISTPTLLLSAGSDWVVKNSAQRKFFDGLSSPIKEMITFDGFYHAILHEKDRRQPMAQISRFISQVFGQPARRKSLLDADQSGYTHEELNRLSKPLRALSLKWWNFTIQRIVMKTICRLSRGIRLGWTSGFDSGQTLDYVYTNQAQGIGPLGKIIDRAYLNSIGWSGIRMRKTHLQQTLREAIGLLGTSAKPVHIVDIAAGGGRYTLQVLGELKGTGVTALLRDRSSDALAVARQTAAALGLSNVQFAGADAFDAESLANLEPKPNIAIVSGLYELFGDNQMVRASLSGLAQAIEPGGFLIYTNQPWHPQLEMIARVLVNRDGEAWIMRRRSQEEMDQLVQAAGFQKLDMKIDKHGIFTVSIARRMAR